jgi:hypothetical protein
MASKLDRNERHQKAAHDPPSIRIPAVRDRWLFARTCFYRLRDKSQSAGRNRIGTEFGNMPTARKRPIPPLSRGLAPALT